MKVIDLKQISGSGSVGEKTTFYVNYGITLELTEEEDDFGDFIDYIKAYNYPNQELLKSIDEKLDELLKDRNIRWDDHYNLYVKGETNDQSGIDKSITR